MDLNHNYSERIALDIEVSIRVVDMNSWTRLTCYPWRSFYSISDDPTIQRSPDH